MSKGWQSPRMRGRAYRRLRASLLTANDADPHWRGRCHLQIKGVCTGKATQVHHTLGIARTGHDPRYMQPTCAACNLHVGDPQQHADPPHSPVTEW